MLTVKGTHRSLNAANEAGLLYFNAGVVAHPKILYELDLVSVCRPSIHWTCNLQFYRGAPDANSIIATLAGQQNMPFRFRIYGQKLKIINFVRTVINCYSKPTVKRSSCKILHTLENPCQKRGSSVLLCCCFVAMVSSTVRKSSILVRYNELLFACWLSELC